MSQSRLQNHATHCVLRNELKAWVEDGLRRIRQRPRSRWEDIYDGGRVREARLRERLAVQSAADVSFRRQTLCPEGNQQFSGFTIGLRSCHARLCTPVLGDSRYH